MSSVIDAREYPVYSLYSDPEMEKKKRGTYSTEEILEAARELYGQEKNETYSVKEILEAVEALNEQN
jgi:ASC-1-like (ASCH) protein